MLLAVGAQISDGRLAALIGMLRPKSRIETSPATTGEQCKCATHWIILGKANVK